MGSSSSRSRRPAPRGSRVSAPRCRIGCFRDAESTLVTSNPAPDTLQIDNTLTSSLTESRWVQFGLSASYVPTYTSADLATWGGCTNNQSCTISSLYNFTGALPQTVLGITLGAFDLLGQLLIVLVLSIYWSADQEHFKRLWLSRAAL